ncbi:hypothetical protein [Paraburkholderia sp. MM6662-R1]|uniref:hypothetical protein n=1 Tax=Paraburkholderia sp. MM6662-R1 TaxID=2991066 RepID=UPI003D25AAF3
MDERVFMKVGAMLNMIELQTFGAIELNDVARTALARGWEHVQALDPQIAWCDTQVATHVKHDSNAQRAVAIIGIGPLTASATVATCVDHGECIVRSKEGRDHERIGVIACVQRAKKALRYAVERYAR